MKIVVKLNLNVSRCGEYVTYLVDQKISKRFNRVVTRYFRACFICKINNLDVFYGYLLGYFWPEINRIIVQILTSLKYLEICSITVFNHFCKLLTTELWFHHRKMSVWGEPTGGGRSTTDTDNSQNSEIPLP